MNSEQLKFYRAGADVTRYHTLFTIQKETVGHHSHGVAVLCLFLRPDASAELLKAALYHDLAEHVTGDIPAPAKHLFGISKQFSDLEDSLMEEVGLVFPGLDGYEKRTLKLADIAQGALFCKRELELGNTAMRVVFDRYISYADDIGLVGREEELFELIRGESL